MIDPAYWKRHYVVESDADVIEGNIKISNFISDSRSYELIYFEKGREAPNILISQGSAGHAYVFAELAYMMHLRGYNVFVMPKHGGVTIDELVKRHFDAVTHISRTFNPTVGVFAEGLGCYAAFYMAVAGGPLKSIACLNGPAIMTEDKFREAIFGGGSGAAGRRKRLLPVIRLLARIAPWVKIRISTYLDFEELIDSDVNNRKIEEPFVRGFAADPDFDTHYPLSAVMSLVNTPPPRPLSELRVPTMFIIPKRGFFPGYFLDLYDRLPDIEKEKVEVDGGVFWMLSHPEEAARIVSGWFDRTL